MERDAAEDKAERAAEEKRLELEALAETAEEVRPCLKTSVDLWPSDAVDHRLPSRSLGIADL